MSDSKLTPPAGEAPMSVRECRLILERLLVAAGLPAGAVLSVRDVLLDAELRGLGLLALLHREPELLEGATIEPLRPVGANGELRLDAGGQFSLFVAPAILDLLIEHSAAEGVCRLRVVGVDRPALLDALVISGRAAGLAVDVDPDGPTTAII